MLESIGIDDAIQKSNPNESDVTKVLSLPSWLEIGDQYSLVCKDRAQLSQCESHKHLPKSLSEIFGHANFIK